MDYAYFDVGRMIKLHVEKCGVVTETRAIVSVFGDPKLASALGLGGDGTIVLMFLWSTQRRWESSVCEDNLVFDCIFN